MEIQAGITLFVKEILTILLLDGKIRLMSQKRTLKITFCYTYVLLIRLANLNQSYLSTKRGSLFVIFYTNSQFFTLVKFKL